MQKMGNGKQSGGRIADTVYDAALPVAEALALVIWDVEYVKEGGRYVLRITVDKEDGVNIEDCEAFHRAIDPVLDVVDPIADPYILEVSSPGIERELKNDFHLSACEGWDVEVKLYAPLNGSKLYRGELLLSDEEGRICIRQASGEEIAFERATVAKVQTYFDFSSVN